MTNEQTYETLKNSTKIVDGFYITKDGIVISEEPQEFNCLVCHKPTKQPICNDCKLKHI